MNCKKLNPEIRDFAGVLMVNADYTADKFNISHWSSIVRKM
jgi:hypothetical protein